MLEESIELKYFDRISNKNAVQGKLAKSILPDPEYPQAYIHSVYLASPDLRELTEKLDSSYLKTKYRFRSYAATETYAEEAIYFEKKIKMGNLRSKTRSKWGPESIIKILGDKNIPSSSLPIMGKQPLIYFTYFRERFIHVKTGSRINFDTRIKVHAYNKLLLPSTVHPKFGIYVFEVKSDCRNKASEVFKEAEIESKSFSKFALVTRIIKDVSLGGRSEFNGLFTSDAL